MPERKRNLLIAREAAMAMAALRRVWVNTTGHASGVEVGVILTEVFYTSSPWVTAQYITGRLNGAYSDDTVRRRLDEMTERNRAEVTEAGGRKLYRACAHHAAATIAVFQEACGNLAN